VHPSDISEPHSLPAVRPRLQSATRGMAVLTTVLTASLLMLLAGCSKTDDRYVRNSADAAHARIGVITGSTPAQLAHERFPDADIQEYGDFTDTLGALQAGRIDVTITAINNAILAARNNPDLEVIEDSLRDETTAVAIRKGNTALLDQVNAIIAAIKADGTLADIDRRWLKREPGPYEEVDVPEHTQGELLRVGVNATREPFSFVDQNGRITGHDGELARVIADRLQRPMEFVDVRWDALIPALQSGKIDMVVTGMTANEERRQFVDFSTPYYMNKLVLLVRKPGAAGAVPAAGGLELASVEGLKTRRLGVLQGSAFDTYAQKNFPQADIRQFIGFADVLLAVETGQVDAAFTDTDGLREAQKTRPEFVAIGEPVFHSDVAAGFRKDSGELRAAYNAFLAQIRADGTHDDLIRRWTEEGSTAMPDIRFTGEEEPLRVGNAILGLPQVAVKDNELVGQDVELAIRFAQYLGRRPEWVTVDWAALIPSLVSGKTDVIISSMFVTPERQERIDFSEPYYRTANYVFTLQKNLAGHSPATSAGEAASEESFWAGVARSFHSNIIREDRYLMLLDGLKTTMVLAILSSLFGTVLGALICFMRMSRRLWLQIPAKIYIAILRGVPVLVLLMLIFYVIFASVQINPVLVAVIAFGLNFAAYAAEIFRVGIQSIDRGQTEAGTSMGFGKIATFRYIILPQTIQRILPVYKGEFISMVKMTSIVGYVAVEDLTKVSDIIRSRTFDAFFPLVMVAVLYFLLAYALIQALEYLERRTDPMRRRSARVRA
jgi:polar amino acid transport system substrate-binding protein